VNLAEVGRFWARWQPDAIALASGDTALSWADVELRSRHTAAGLHALGVRPGDRVGILGANSLAWCELVIGVLRAGAVVVPLNTRVTGSELAYLVDTAAPRAVAVDATLWDRYAPLAADRPGIALISLDSDPAGPGAVTMSSLRARGEVIGTEQGEAAIPEAAVPEVAIAEADPAIIAFTSGTTGYPKGAILTHGNLLATINHYTRFEGWSAATTMLCCVPLAFTGGIVSNLLITYGVGGRLLLAEFEPRRVLELIVKESVNALMLVPIFYQGLTEVPGFADADLSSLTSAITGGAVVGEPLLRRYHAKGVHIRQAYSLTEAAASATLLPSSHFLTKRDTAGLTGIHTRLRILAADGTDAPTGEVGEIVLRGPQVSPGYWNDPDATAAALVDGWLHTGDLGSLDTEGFLRVVDRKKDMIISGGLNVYPAEVERIAAEFPGVSEAGAFAVPHDRWGETVGLVVGGAATLDLTALYRHCREHLSDYKVPRYLVQSSRPLPRSMSGKILRRTLRDQFDPAVAWRTPAS
jgi:fatty-acyl-CoA synthase